MASAAPAVSNSLRIFLLLFLWQMSAALNTIFLSSFSTMDSRPTFRQLVRSSFNVKHLVYVPTAAYCLDPKSSRPLGEQRRRARYDAKQKAALLSESFNADKFSLLELDSPGISEEMIKEKIHGADLIYVDGGNTFYLQRHIIESSFWDAIDSRLKEGCLYIGASAGAIVAGQSIETALWKGWDDPAVAGDDFIWNEKSLRGRGLTDFSVFMHYNEDAHADLVSTQSRTLDHKVETISDHAAFINFKEGVLNSVDSEISSNLSDFASLKVPEIVLKLKQNEFFDIRIVCSDASLHFFKAAEVYDPLIWNQFKASGGESLVFTDKDEWSMWSKIGDPVLHIDLSLWADIVIVAPASADIIAKINAGISDTLLLSVLRAWDLQKPCILCPAMNTMMWEHPITERTLNELKSLGWQIIDPVIKTLACNVVGMGAMAHVEDIVSYINNIAEKSGKKSLLRNDAFDKPSSSSSASSSSASVITSVDVPRVKRK